MAGYSSAIWRLTWREYSEISVFRVQHGIEGGMFETLRHGYIFGHEVAQKCRHLQKVSPSCDKAFLTTHCGVAT